MGKQARLGTVLVFVAVFLPLVMWFIWGEGYSPKYGLAYSMQRGMRLVFAKREPGYYLKKLAQADPLKYGHLAQTQETACPFKFIVAGAVACLGVGAYALVSGAAKSRGVAGRSN